MENHVRYVLLMKTVPLEDFSPLEPEFKVIHYDRIREDQKHMFYTVVLPKVEAILATGPVNSELIAKAFSLKCIVVNGAGYDDIDVAAATALRVPVYNIPDITAYSTAELAFSMMLTLFRRSAELDRKLRSAKDPASVFGTGLNPGHTLMGKTLGIIGLGHIGTQVAQIGKFFRMNVIYTQRHQTAPLLDLNIRWVPMRTLLHTSDIITIHTPLTEKTRGMINEDAFLQMKEGAVLINTARGAIVDQTQLVRFLEHGKLGGAGLDVFPNETEIDPRLLKMDNVLLTPHIGTNTYETREQMAAQMIQIVRAVCNGKSAVPGNLVNYY